jgi:glucosylglycerol 3-phosphatase
LYLSTAKFSRDLRPLRDALTGTVPTLLIQDLDGVCMGLVGDPLTRCIERRYVEACRAFADHFFVLTNGEHIGRRGVNRIVEAAVGGAERAREEALYLPGLAGGGVQLQDARAQVTHPGVSREELAFLDAVPARAMAMLRELLSGEMGLDSADADRFADVCVLDNAVSPTLNLNPLHEHLASTPASYTRCQEAAAAFLEAELDRAGDAGLGGSFFIHFAPNLGRDERGVERMKLAGATDAGTTDFQFMLRGAIKEAGVLVLLNRYFFRHHGTYPLGEDFNVREAPADGAALVDLAARHFPAGQMPRIVGVGDTVTSHPSDEGHRRGGSDRGFLQLVQDLGLRFGTDNATVFVDSSAGEVRRPGLQGDPLDGRGEVRWEALAGISDRDDPLTLNFIVPGGHRHYLDFFCDAAGRRENGRRIA